MIRRAIGESDAWPEVTAFEFTGRMREVEDLRVQVENRPLVVLFGGREIERISDAEIQRQPWRELPIIPRESLGNVRARLDHVLLNVDREGVHLAQQQGRQRVAAASDSGGIAARSGEGKRSCGIRWIEHIERLTTDVNPKLERVATAHQREGVEVFGDRGRKVGIRSSRGSDLLQARDSENGKHRAERVGRQSRNGDTAILERRLVQVPAGVAEAQLIQSAGRKGPVIIPNESIAPSERVTDDSRGQTSTSVRQRSDGSVIVAKIRITAENAMLFAKVPINAKIRLVLIVRFRRRADVVVGSGHVRQRVVAKDQTAQAIEPAGRNVVARKLRARRCGGIVDRLCKDALALSERWHDTESRQTGAKARALPVHEKEGLVVLNGSA